MHQSSHGIDGTNKYNYRLTALVGQRVEPNK